MPCSGPDPGPPGLDRSDDIGVEDLNRELQATKAYLQTVLDRQQQVNDDLVSSNQDLVSGNEELQSLNEELGTAKEELQSTNEELSTLNQGRPVVKTFRASMNREVVTAGGVRIRGQAARGYPKKSYKFDFNRGYHFSNLTWRYLCQ